MARAFEAGDVYPSEEVMHGLPDGEHWYEHFGASSSMGWDGRWKADKLPPAAHRDIAFIDNAEHWLAQQAMGPYPEEGVMGALSLAMAMEPFHKAHIDIHRQRIDSMLEREHVEPSKLGEALRGAVGVQGHHRGRELQGAAHRIEAVFRKGHEKEREQARHFRAWVLRHQHTFNLRRDLVSLALQVLGFPRVAVIDERVITFLTGVTRSEGLFDLALAKEGFYRILEDLLVSRTPKNLREGSRHALPMAAAWFAANRPSFRKFWSLVGIEAKTDPHTMAEAILYSLSRYGSGATGLGLANTYGSSLVAANADDLHLPPTGHVGGKDMT